MKLLIHPLAEPAEHGLGYRLRLAELNGLRTIGWLPRHDSRAQDKLAAVRTWRYARHCPRCLEETGRWLDDWTLAFLPFCERHQTWLTDSCWRCRRKLTWAAMRLTHCQCGADLREGKTAALDGGLQQLVAARGRPTAPQARTPAQLPVLSPTEFARLILAIGGAYAFPRTERAKRKICRSDFKQCAKVAVVAGAHLFPWPDAMCADLHDLLRRRSHATPEPMAITFARLYRPLHRELGEPTFEFLRAELSDFVNQYWPEPITRRHWPIQKPNEILIVPLSVAARKHGTRAATLLKICHAAQIAPRIKKPLQGRRPQRLLARKDIERLGAWINDLLSVRQAAQALGISRPRVLELIQGGELRTVVGRRTGAKLQRTALMSWVQRLLKRARHAESAPELVDLGHALRFIVPRGHFSTVLCAVERNKLPLYFTDNRPDRIVKLFVSRERLANCLALALNTEWMTVPEAARRLHVKEEVAYALVRQRLLASTVGRVTVRSCRVVGRDALDQFNARYISAVALARAHHTSPRSVVCRLRRVGIHPATGPAIDGCRQAFYQRRMIPARL